MGTEEKELVDCYWLVDWQFNEENTAKEYPLVEREAFNVTFDWGAFD